MPSRKRKNKTKRRLPSQDKSLQQANERYIVGLFADIVGCSEISNHMDLCQYNAFLKDFQDLFCRICDHYKVLMYEETEYPFFRRSARGDEGCLMIFVSKDDSLLARDVDVAIKIAFDLKRAWIFTTNNVLRIERDGLLPVDIAIGIHAGKVWVNKDQNDEYRPEGYAINLSKRIESESRRGRFTHILLSEAARGQLYNLKDEDTYIFDDPFAMTPKGISRTVNVFEIKHHFLPTDWNDDPSAASILYEDVDEAKLAILQTACKANPTNLWLAEEHIWLATMKEFRELSLRHEEGDPKALQEAYRGPLETARRIANSDMRDAGTLAIWGFIEGERGEYEEELKRYNEALGQSTQYGNIYWYKALAMSYQVYSRLMESKAKVTEFYHDSKNGEEIIETLEAFDKALELKPFNPWIAYDYACELAWWSQADTTFKKQAINMLVKAVGLNSETKTQAADEEYLKPVIDERQIKRHLE